MAIVVQLCKQLTPQFVLKQAGVHVLSSECRSDLSAEEQVALIEALRQQVREAQDEQAETVQAQHEAM
eukprot:SAG11_NODE_17123_length_528_cov_0.578089_2_plen_67_part_01